MVQEQFKHGEITEADKMLAIESLKKEMRISIDNQTKQFEETKEHFHWQRRTWKWMVAQSILSSIIVVIMLTYVIHSITKPVAASLLDIKYINERAATLNTREKAFQQRVDHENEQTNKERESLGSQRKDLIHMKQLDSSKKK